MKKITIAIMIVVIAIVVGWDLVVAVNSIKGDTISEIIQKISYEHPVVPLIFGTLGSHFFWAGKPLFDHYSRYLILIGIGIATAIAGIWTVSICPLWPILIGIPLGRLLWPQNIKK